MRGVNLKETVNETNFLNRSHRDYVLGYIYFHFVHSRMLSYLQKYHNSIMKLITLIEQDARKLNLIIRFIRTWKDILIQIYSVVLLEMFLGVRFEVSAVFWEPDCARRNKQRKMLNPA